MEYMEKGKIFTVRKLMMGIPKIYFTEEEIMNDYKALKMMADIIEKHKSTKIKYFDNAKKLDIMEDFTKKLDSITLREPVKDKIVTKCPEKKKEIKCFPKIKESIFFGKIRKLEDIEFRGLEEIVKSMEYRWYMKFKYINN
jgi:hypothetical protein